ncbi:DUF4160 domain-containing protein [Photobacterium damselae]|uniref:DUF4160 domain-containing protein n=1 Tax=Photobacterium damselae TaxID=38293 RepID=UPI002F3F9E18
MPLIDLWRGIKFMMYFQDHNPPHFHVMYQGQKALFRIDNCELLSGNVPPKTAKLVKEWWTANKERLLVEWENFSNGS